MINKYKRNTTIIVKEMKNEAFLLNIKKNQLITLNETGLEIWKLLWKPRAQKEIVEILYSRYESPKEKIEKDVYEYLANAQKSNIILTF